MACPCLCGRSVWANGASFGPVILYRINYSNGKVLQQLRAPAAGANTGNGRAVCVVHSIIYYSFLNGFGANPNVYATNAQGDDFGVIFSMRDDPATGNTRSISTINWDGNFFYLTPYDNSQFLWETYDINGNFVNAIAGNSSYSDGLYAFGKNYPILNNNIIKNRTDGGFGVGVYDMYDKQGNVAVAGLIDKHGAGTGITFDGNNLIVSGLNSLSQYDLTGNFKKSVFIQASVEIEDLSIPVDISGNIL